MGSLHCQDSAYLLLILCHSLRPAVSFLSVYLLLIPSLTFSRQGLTLAILELSMKIRLASNSNICRPLHPQC